MSELSICRELIDRENQKLPLFSSKEDLFADDETDASSIGRSKRVADHTYTVPEVPTGENPTLEAFTWFRGFWRRFWDSRQSWTLWQWFAYYIPILQVIRTYNVREWLIRDILASLSVTSMLVPQAVSYARLAGLPTTIGLYGACIPVVFYAIFGTSRQIGVGPVAVTSLMFGSGLPQILGPRSVLDPNDPDDLLQKEYNMAAVQVAFIVGILYSSLGVLNFGFVINLLSHSVLAGFMSGATVIIGMSQARYMMGYSTRFDIPKNTTVPFPRHDPVHLQLADLFSAEWLAVFKWQEFVMSAAWLFILFSVKFISGKFKKLALLRAFGPILVVVISTSIVNIAHLDQPPTKIKVVGNIPRGLPHLQPASTFSHFDHLGPKITLAIAICIVDVIESMSIARALAMANGYEIEPSRELRGLGIANLLGSAFGCYTITGAFSRSAVNNACGCVTQLSGLLSGLTVMIVLLWLTPLFARMPNNALGAIVIFAVSNLFKFKECLFLWRVNKFDWFVFVVAASTVMFLGVEYGLAISIAVSIAIVLFKTAFPRVSTLGKLPGTAMYRNTAVYKIAVPPEHGLIVRIDAPLFFGNITPVRDKIEQLERAHVMSGRELRWVILDCSPINDVDASAMHFLKDWVSEHKNRGIKAVFANPSDVVLRMMDRTGVVELVGQEWIHVSEHAAVSHCKRVLGDKPSRKKFLRDDGTRPTHKLKDEPEEMSPIDDEDEDGTGDEDDIGDEDAICLNEKQTDQIEEMEYV